MEHVVIERNDGISYIHLNRPENYNALNKSMLEELSQAVIQVTRNSDQIIILHGNGNAFSAGGDMNMLQQIEEKETYEEIMEMIKRIVHTLYMTPKLVISAVRGAAAGLGLSIALVADYIVAHEEARFGMLFIGIGLAPDGGGHFFLQERLGTQAAKQFIWNKEQVKGAEAIKRGLIDYVTTNDVLKEATKLAKRFLQAPLPAMIASKKIYHEAKEQTLLHMLAQETKTQWELRQTKDHLEGVTAFIEKRTPLFTGK